MKVYVSVTFRRKQSSKYIRETKQTAQRSTTEKGLRESPAAFSAGSVDVDFSSVS
jgi:hypothetical protein